MCSMKKQPPVVFYKKSVLKVRLSPSKKKFVICQIESPLNMTKNVFLFHLKSFFRSQDIKVFVTTFWSCRKNGFSDLLAKIIKANSDISNSDISQKVTINVNIDLSAKVFQRCFYKQISQYFEGITSKYQYSFWKGHTAQHALISLLEKDCKR